MWCCLFGKTGSPARIHNGSKIFFIYHFFFDWLNVIPVCLYCFYSLLSSICAINVEVLYVTYFLCSVCMHWWDVRKWYTFSVERMSGISLGKNQIMTVFIVVFVYYWRLVTWQLVYLANVVIFLRFEYFMHKRGMESEASFVLVTFFTLLQAFIF